MYPVCINVSVVQMNTLKGLLICKKLNLYHYYYFVKHVF